LGFITLVAVLDSRLGSVTDYAFAAGIGFLTCIPGHLLLRALYPGLRTPLNFDLSWFDGIVIAAWMVFGAQMASPHRDTVVIGALLVYAFGVVPLRKGVWLALQESLAKGKR
jgi:hypothetical protein